jgi:hypothetical protein
MKNMIRFTRLPECLVYFTFLMLSVGCQPPSGEMAVGTSTPSQDGSTIELDAGSDAGDSDAGDSDAQGLVYEAQPAILPRLTVAQYLNTVKAVFGSGLPKILLEADTNPDLFYSIGATTTDVTERAVELFSDAAYAIAAFAFAPERRVQTLECAPLEFSDSCVANYIQRIGRKLFRRPLTVAEQDRWLNLAMDTHPEDIYRGLEHSLAGMLQSPYFLYRVELGLPDPADDRIRRYTPFEMAQRLSFTIINSGPDDMLLDAAQAGELLDNDSIAYHAQRLLVRAEAAQSIQAFFSQYLDLGRLDSVDRPIDLHPQFSRQLIDAMKTEVTLLVNDIIFTSPRDIRGLFSEPRGYVNAPLAALYEVDATGASANTFVPITFNEDTPRAGILTLGAFLTMNAHPTDTSPTLRGKYIRERVFCQEVPAPPDDIDLNLDPSDDSAPTLRGRLEAHRETPECAGCHSFIDPPGFLFENYDAIGKYRTESEGYPVDSTGELDGTPLANAVELADHLTDNETLVSCLVQQLYRHTQGRREEPNERPMLRALEAQLAQSGYDFKSLMLALVQSPGFRTIANEGSAP